MADSADVLARELLARHKHCVIATASSDGKPEAATINFAEDKDYTIYFETLTTNRKYANLCSNPRASIVVTEKPYTIQMDGTVKELADAQTARTHLCKKLGKEPSIFSNKDIRFFQFTPTWIRIRTKAGPPPEYVMIRG